MSTDLQGTTVGAQEDGSGEGQGQTSTSDNSSAEPTRDQADGGSAIDNEQIGAEKLPPELEVTRKELMRDYHSKMQGIKDDRLRFENQMEKYKATDATMQQLLQQEWFKKAATEERARRSGQVPDFNLTDEQFEAARTDKSAFLKLVQNVADQVASAKVGRVEPGLGDAQKSLNELKTEREFDRVATKYKDFAGLNEKGALDSYLEKGHDFETAYARYRLDHPEAAKPAAVPLTETQRREGSVSPGGATRVNGQKIIRAKNFEDAFDAAWLAEVAGDKNYKIERATK